MKTMKRIRSVLTFLPAILLTVVFLIGCGSTTTETPLPAAASSPTTVPTAIPPTVVPTLLPTAPPTQVPEATIQTPLGDLVIKEVELPSEDFMGNKPQPGYQILLVWLESPDDKVSGMELFDMHKGVSVTADDGSKTESYGGGLAEGRLVIGFTPPAKARNFTLHWHDNPPIRLDK
jgi:hypothetical protein